MTPKPTPQETENNIEDGTPEANKWSNLIYGDNNECDQPIATASVWKQPSPTKPKNSNDKNWQKLIYGEKFYNDNIASILDDWDNEGNKNARTRYKWRSFAQLPPQTRKRVGVCIVTCIAVMSATLLLILIVLSSNDYDMKSDYFVPNGKHADAPLFESKDATLKIDSDVEPFVITDTKMRTIDDNKERYDDKPYVTDDDVRKLFEIENNDEEELPPLLRRVV